MHGVPHDECFGVGGTLARSAREGAHFVLVCATRGEVGEIANPALATPETLGEVREGELYCAAEALGLAEVIFLGYRDSGMAGTPQNENPRAFVKADAYEVVGRLVGILRRVRPEVVITFEPEGGYGHPDHIAIHRHTVTAFHAAASSEHYPDEGPPWQATRLLYTVVPRSRFLEFKRELEAAGVDTSGFDRFEEGSIGWPDERVQITLDVSATVDAKWQAFQCHRTQFGPENPFQRLTPETMKRLLSREYLAIAWPEPEPGLALHDLLEGL